MLTHEDCLGFSELTEEEILAIAEHEHIPELAALEFGNFLLRARDGERRIRRIIQDDIAHARQVGDTRHASALKLVLRQFREHHCA